MKPHTIPAILVVAALFLMIFGNPAGFVLGLALALLAGVIVVGGRRI